MKDYSPHAIVFGILYVACCFVHTFETTSSQGFLGMVTAIAALRVETLKTSMTNGVIEIKPGSELEVPGIICVPPPDVVLSLVLGTCTIGCNRVVGPGRGKDRN
jgi:hypothetical protein